MPKNPPKTNEDANGPAPMDSGAVKGRDKNAKGKNKGNNEKGDPGKGKWYQQLWSQSWQTQPGREWEQKSGNTWGDKGKQKCKAHQDGNRKAKCNKGDNGKIINPHASKQCHICKMYVP